MYTHKSRMLAAFRGEEVDRLPYVPRLDLWYLANSVSGTLPEQHAGRTQNEIARAEGWSVYFRFADDMLDLEQQKDYLHRGIGVFSTRDTLYDFVLPRDVEVKVQREHGRIRVEYHTPVGMVSSTMFYDQSSQRLGITSPMIVDHMIKSPGDYGPVGYLFERMDVVPNFARFERWMKEEMRDDGVAVAQGFMGASPVHQIQRDLLDPTQFYFHYKDHNAKMMELAGKIEPLFHKALKILCNSPAEVIWWGANFDDMLTYPPYFEKEISPWIRKASQELGAAGKMVLCHTDGENEGLMDLIRDSGMHIAESICPAPMTRITLAEFYRRWSGHLTLCGGIPSTIVLPDTSEADFEAYMDQLFKAVAPGRRMVVGIADQVPPNAVFSRLQRIGERVEREGRLPLVAGAFRAAVPASPEPLKAAPKAAETQDAGNIFAQVRLDVTRGKHLDITFHVQELLDRDIPAEAILDQGLIAAISAVGRRMALGEAFIPEVLLAARAMTAAVAVLEPYLAAGGEAHRGKVLIGTVKGDMHDIGKNLVVTMLRGVGFEVLDLGINVSRKKFCDAVAEFKPDVLGLSALLTTTMVEMGEVIRSLDERNLRSRCKVMVGGAPVSEEYAHRIGADGFAAGAAETVALVKQLVAAGAETRAA
ncbi:MAG: cobalamin B12-binding domain-containing protein [Betaproteobacteria bacterium]|nr:cobalamin B12-binding domain-containing protein [Betaproteobacteria bacterium]